MDSSTHTRDEGLEFSFACGGWLQFYLFGVADCFKNHNLNVNCQAIGCSAGSLAAAGITVGGDFRKVLEFCKSTLIPECRRDIQGPFKISQYVSRCLDVAADLANFENGNDKLIVQTTSVPSFKSVRVSKFQSIEDLKKTLMASCAAFPLSPLVRRMDGKLYVDGGLSDFQPILSKKTITVNPFYFWNADIKPSRYVPCNWAVLPPKDPSTVDWLFDLGYKDCLDWMSKNGYSCPHHSSDHNHNCSMRLKRAPHKYDNHQKSSFQRFFGYGPSIPVLDFLTQVWLNLLWKPIAVVFILTELSALAIFSAFKAIFMELCPIIPLLLVGCFLIFPHVLESVILLLLAASAKLCICGSTGLEEWQNTFKYAKAACTPTLFLRSLPVIGSYFILHHDLQNHSLFYRIAMHFI